MARGFLEDIIRSVREGDIYQKPLADVNEKSYRAKVSQLNRKDGYQHYSIAVSRSMGMFFIKNNGGCKNGIE